MNEAVNVFEINAIATSISEIKNITQETYKICEDSIYSCNKVLNETYEEERRSYGFLNAAKLVEESKLAILIVAEAELAAASAEEVAAVASANPFAIAAASARVADAVQRFSVVQEEYEQAKQHREALEPRYELAVKCLNIAQEMYDTLQMKYKFSEAKIREKSDRGLHRMINALQDLQKYLSEVVPEVLAEIQKWDDWKPNEREPASPKTVHDRLNVSNSIIKAILIYLYTVDPNFRDSVNNYRQEGTISGNRESVIVKIKKNMTGRLSEEIVIRAFGPLGTSVETQGRTYLDDGSYTKTDLIVKNLKSPLILGKGEGMGAREGSDLAIEVKAGRKEYIYSQKEHMKKQANGHASSKVSCTVCTRDIKELSPEREMELRRLMAEAGSPLLGMLPPKVELDTACIEFVFGE